MRYLRDCDLIYTAVQLVGQIASFNGGTTALNRTMGRWAKPRQTRRTGWRKEERRQLVH